MRPLVRIPRSASRRGAFDGAQLIRRIVHGRLGAFRLEGEFLRPGELMPESALWPGPEWPRLPHLLEVCRSDQSRAGHGGGRIDVILWRYESNDWREVCRLNGYDSSAWMIEMEPMIAHSLNESRAHVEPPDVHAIAEQLVAPIAAQLAGMESREHREALATEVFTRMMFIMSEQGGESAG